MDEQTRIDAIVQTIRVAVDDVQSTNVDLQLTMFPAQKQQFLAKTFQAVLSTYQDREVGIARHLTLVWVLSDLLSKKAGISVDLFLLCLASFLHDIGKAAVLEPVFLLPRKLTQEEDAAKRKHTVLGGRICQKLGNPFAEVASAVRSHHENWNGSGYPNGLAGESIPLMARLLRVADVASALRTKRHYRDAFSLEESREILYRMQKSGPVFDPTLIPFIDELFQLTK